MFFKMIYLKSSNVLGKSVILILRSTKMLLNYKDSIFVYVMKYVITEVYFDLQHFYSMKIVYNRN